MCLHTRHTWGGEGGRGGEGGEGRGGEGRERRKGTKYSRWLYLWHSYLTLMKGLKESSWPMVDGIVGRLLARWA